MKPEENIGLEPVGSTRMALAGRGMRALSGGATAFFRETLGLQDGGRIKGNTGNNSHRNFLHTGPWTWWEKGLAFPSQSPVTQDHRVRITLSHTCALEAPVQMSPTAGLVD